MAIQKVTYEDKVDLKIWASIPNTNKIKADDMNEIKGAINENADELSKSQKDITSQNKQLQILTNALPSETQEGESINIKGTIPVKFKEFKLSGNSKQDGEPTPETPIAIQNIEGDVNVTACNKNLFDGDIKQLGFGQVFGQPTKIMKGDNYRGTYVKIKANNYYSVSREKLTNRFRAVFTETKPVSGIEAFGGTENNTTYDNSYKIENIKAPENANYLFIYLSNQGDNTDEINLQIEENITSTDYIPNEQQTVTFPLSQGQKLYKGDYLADDGIHHVRKQVELDGTEDIVLDDDLSETLRFYVKNIVNDYKKDIKNASSSHFKYLQIYGQDAEHFYITSDDTYYVFFYISKSIANTEEGVRTWLSSQKQAETPVILEYELAEEEIEPYTEEQQEAYNQLKQLTAYEEETNIYSTNSTSPIFKVTAIKNANAMYENLNSKIENIIELLSTTATSAMLLENMQSDLESEVM